MEPLLPVTPPQGYVNSLILVIAITLFGQLVRSFISPTNLLILFLLAVVVAAFYWGLGPAIFTAVVGVLAFDFFFIPPFMTFRVMDTEYLITFAGMIVVGAVVSFLVARARENAAAAQTRERETGTLYGLSQNLAVAGDLEAVVGAVIRHVQETFGWESILLLPEDDALVPMGASPVLTLDEKEMAVATWAYTHGAVAGYDTDTLPASRLRYIPLRGSEGVLGILGVLPTDGNGCITPEQARMLEAFAGQAALALERVRVTCSHPGG
jgi:two-component system sensor histidine kinase KdpD